LTDQKENIAQLAQVALKDESVRNRLANELEGSSRRARQMAASVLEQVAREDVKILVPYSDQIVDALNRPEAQTRWACLEILTRLVDVDSRVCDKAVDGAEAGLFDEESGLVRLAAMRFLCELGRTTDKRSQRVWPLIDEGIQCYHGDPEFQEMLNAVIRFSTGKLNKDVKDQLRDRMSFDAESGKGALKKRATEIVNNLS